MVTFLGSYSDLILLKAIRKFPEASSLSSVYKTTNKQHQQLSSVFVNCFEKLCATSHLEYASQNRLDGHDSESYLRFIEEKAD